MTRKTSTESSYHGSGRGASTQQRHPRVPAQGLQTPGSQPLVTGPDSLHPSDPSSPRPRQNGFSQPAPGPPGRRAPGQECGRGTPPSRAAQLEQHPRASLPPRCAAATWFHGECPPARVHMNGFSPVWIRWRRWRALSCVNCLPHWSQQYGRLLRGSMEGGGRREGASLLSGQYGGTPPPTPTTAGPQEHTPATRGPGGRGLNAHAASAAGSSPTFLVTPIMHTCGVPKRHAHRHPLVLI